MPTSGDDPTWGIRRRYFPAVEGMRGVAALLVLGGHLLLLSYAGNDFLITVGRWAGHCGVTAFFVISGFLLYRPFVGARAGRRGPALGDFWVRRAVRILPAYWVALTAVALIPALGGSLAPDWWANYGLLQIYSASWMPTGLSQGWSLCVEASFYLALPALALALRRRGFNSGGEPSRELRWELGLLGGLAVLSLLWRAVMAEDATTAYLENNLLGTFSWFFLGMVLAVMELSRAGAAALPRVQGALSRSSACLVASGGAFALLVGGWHRDAGLPQSVVAVIDACLAAVFAAGLVGPAVFSEGGRLVRGLFANRLIVYLGLISYGVYLWHLPVAIWLGETSFVNGSGAPLVALATATLAFSIALGTLSWYVIERPLMRRARSAISFADPERGGLRLASPADGGHQEPHRDRDLALPLRSPGASET